MQLSFLLMQQIVSMILMALAGYALGRTKIVTGENSRALSCVSVYLVIPCNLIISFISNKDSERLLGLGLSLATGLLIHVMYLVVNIPMSRGKMALTKEEQTSVIYNNAGNLIIPIVQSILGPEYVLYTSPYLLVQNILLWTHGQRLMGGEKSFRLRNVLTVPAIVGVEIGLVLFITGLPLPTPLFSAMNSLSNCAAPLCMLVTGIAISELKIKEVITYPRIYLVTFIRLVLLPGLTIAVLLVFSHLFPLREGTNILTVNLLAAIGPSASVIVQQAQLFHNPHVGYVSSINVLTTMLCVFTMPLAVMAFLALI